LRKLEEFSFTKSNYSSLIYLEIDNFYLIENLFDADFILQISKEIEDCHKEIKDKFCKIKDFFFLEPGKFFFLSLYKDEEELSTLCYQIKTIFEEKINTLIFSLSGYKLDFLVSYALLEQEENISLQLAKSLQKAKFHLKNKIPLKNLPFLKLLEEILEKKNITTLFQPIVNLTTNQVLGFEALSRGPAGTFLESPLNLFKLAEEVGLLFDLEKVCRERAILQAAPFKKEELLFLNIHPRTLADPKFISGETKKLLTRLNISPEQIVFEITERHSTKDFRLFFETLEHYREQGYKIAIDDLGAGHNGLFLVGNIQPDFIKIDRHLIQDIETHPTKQALLEAFLSFAQKMDINIIVEGIETREQLFFLCQLNVPFGQGYFLARPNKEKKYPSLSNLLNKKEHELKTNNTIESITSPVISILPQVKIKEIKKIITKQSPFSGIVVVNEEQRPLGLIMSHHLDRELSTYYGVALYYEKDASYLMDKNPLIVSHDTPVEKVAKLAMQREQAKIYDHIIVVKDNKLKGIVSVQKLTNYLAKLQIELAKDTNPLTGLPGNKHIHQEIEKRIQTNPENLSIIYLDIDNFKVYNDIYGFSRGDEMIKGVAKLLKEVSQKYKAENIFIGHIGGDDFVLITKPSLAEEIASNLCQRFQEHIPAFYNLEHQKQGFLQAKGRDGKEREFPLASISLAIVNGYPDINLEKISTLAAGTKKLAKKIPGCSYALNRRKI